MENFIKGYNFKNFYNIIPFIKKRVHGIIKMLKILLECCLAYQNGELQGHRRQNAVHADPCTHKS